MNIKVFGLIAEGLRNDPQAAEFYLPGRRSHDSYYRSTDKYTIDLSNLTTKGLNRLVELLSAPAQVLIDKNKSMTHFTRLINVINDYIRAMHVEVDLDCNVKNLMSAPAEFYSFVREYCHNKWVVKLSNEGLTYWLFEDAEYHPPVRRQYGYSPAYVSAHFVARHLGRMVRDSFYVYKHDIVGNNIYEVLRHKGFDICTEEGLSQYERDHAQYRQYYQAIGEQVVAHGKAARVATNAKGNSWRYTSSEVDNLSLDDTPTKFVLDTMNDEVQDSRSDTNEAYVSTFWLRDQTETALEAKARQAAKDAAKRNRYADEDDDYEDDESAPSNMDELELTPLPVPDHFWLIGFSLHFHKWYKVHMSNISPYEWAPEVYRSKLVLPAVDDRLIKILVQSTGAKMADIISGKSSGILVLASGPAGTGKTLSAEVTAESVKRPMYSIQSTQLGLNITEIEANLTFILSRAARWRAVLLIDEADVYVRHREKDITQNAIVGVFLRTLEYYPGFLFMTTNMTTSIDDAIISRMTAHIRYDYPTPDAVKRITAIQAESLDIQITDEAYIAMTQQPKLSGRDIRSVLKLCKFLAMAENETVVTADHVNMSLQYQN